MGSREWGWWSQRGGVHGGQGMGWWSQGVVGTRAGEVKGWWDQGDGVMGGCGVKGYGDGVGVVGPRHRVWGSRSSRDLGWVKGWE